MFVEILEYSRFSRFVVTLSKQVIMDNGRTMHGVFGQLTQIHNASCCLLLVVEAQKWDMQYANDNNHQIYSFCNANEKSRLIARLITTKEINHPATPDTTQFYYAITCHF